MQPNAVARKFFLKFTLVTHTVNLPLRGSFINQNPFPTYFITP
jgi:hypothetical protein